MRISISVLKLAVVVTMAATVSAAMAQGQGGRRGQGGGFGGRGGFGGGPGGNVLFLLGIEPVQKELELSGEQKSAVTKVSDEMQEARAGLRDLSQEERREKATALNEQSQKKVDEILLPNQRERLQEIRLQIRGTQALTDATVADKLKLDEGQKQKLTALIDEYRQKRLDLFQGGGGGPPSQEEQDKIRTETEKLRTEESKKAMDLLNEDQRSQFTKMQGKKFDIDPALLRGGRGFGGGGFGPGGGRGNRGNQPRQPDA